LLCNLTFPVPATSLPKDYLDAGADLIETNTFSGTKTAQADYKLEDIVYELNYESAKLAREACDEVTKLNPAKPRFVCGSIGPTNKTASLSRHVEKPDHRDISTPFSLIYLSNGPD